MSQLDKLTNNFFSNQTKEFSTIRDVLNHLKVHGPRGVEGACAWLEDHLWLIGDAASYGDHQPCLQPCDGEHR